MLATIILAAGESSRMAAPKALLPIHGRTFAEEVVRKAKEAGADSIYLVGGAHFQEIKTAFPHLDVLWNPRYVGGQISSLKVGLNQLPEAATQVLVWPVDHPLVEIETIRLMIGTYVRESNPVTIPIFEGRRGHPVLYDREAVRELMALPDSQTAKEMQNIFRNRISYVSVTDPGILIDIDFPEDYQKYIKEKRL